jgi:hypothetical protein
LSIVVNARELDEWGVTGLRRKNDVIDKIKPLTNRYDLAGFRNLSVWAH